MLLTARDLDFAYMPGRPVLRGLGARFPAGAVTTLVGPNGAGKSTLVRLLAGLIRPTRGQVRLDGHDPADLPARRRARLLAYVPQHPRVTFAFSVRQVVGFGTYAHNRVAAVDRALRRMAIADRADEPFAHLSAGQQQRVALARAIAQLDPVGNRVLLADEPVAAMDPRHALAAMDLLRELAREGAAVVVVLHDLTLAARYADRALVLSEDGSAAGEGPGGVTLDPLLLERVYGVRIARIGCVQEGTSGLVPVSRPPVE